MTVSEKTELTRGCNGASGEPEDPEEPEDSEVEGKQSRGEKTERGKRKASVVNSVKRQFLKAETIRKFKSVASHVGLLFTLMLYTAVGGVVFRELELPAELSRLTKLRSIVQTQRRHLVGTITNNTDVSNLATLVSLELEAYEVVVQEAAQAGLLVSFAAKDSLKGHPVNQNADETSSLPLISDRWSVLQAVFFASTVLTTIGYGNMVPTTFGGRVFCIFFALVGIPLTLTVIADWGKIFAGALSNVGRRIKPRIPASWSTCMPTHMAGRRSLGAFVAVVFLFLYLSCGAGMFMLWEEDWGFFEGFYFCFVTMTTIGFGDLVPKKPKYMLLCTLYILVGLALTSTIIELVRRQYAQSWRQLQALGGPLAEALKRLGEHAGGDMSAFQNDLRKVLTVVSMPRMKRGGGIAGAGGGSGTDGDRRQREWEEAVEAVIRDITAAVPSSPQPDKPIVQIVIYESSV
ncbi:TWiK family of potassium channels protein 7 [Neodiprion lecontei]|uniref:TWiK family of potassium channels protein 7 n=1 Tax=Neodiprion lecontei TaxID=441921 RepID=A0A6J0BRZ3_NEOLC|nr:TWiK family of potassium channels protein 7 [Neodiprion lecontei]